MNGSDLSAHTWVIDGPRNRPNRRAVGCPIRGQQMDGADPLSMGKTRLDRPFGKGGQFD